MMIEINSLDEYSEYHHDIIEWCKSVDAPCKITGSMAVQSQHGVLLYGCYKGSEILHSVRFNFPIGKKIFTIVEVLEQDILDEGVAIEKHYAVDGATHIIHLRHGRWAGTNKLVDHAYYVKASDIDATLMTIKYGGRLEGLNAGIA